MPVDAFSGPGEVDAIADREAGHAVADRVDDAGAVAARRVGQRRLDRVGAGADVGLDRVHAGGVDPDPHLARSGPRIGHLGEGQDFGSAEGRHTNGRMADRVTLRPQWPYEDAGRL